jgi:hypothetical protein
MFHSPEDEHERQIDLFGIPSGLAATRISCTASSRAPLDGRLAVLFLNTLLDRRDRLYKIIRERASAHDMRKRCLEIALLLTVTAATHSPLGIDTSQDGLLDSGLVVEVRNEISDPRSRGSIAAPSCARPIG